MTDPCNLPLLTLLNNTDQETLWILDENLPAEFIASVRPRPSLHAVTNRFDTWQALQKGQIDAELNDFQIGDKAARFARIVYRVSKERSLVHHCINQAASALRTSGQLILLGRKNEGIKTHARNAEQVFTGKAFSKKHGLCYTVELNKTGGSGDPLPSDNYPRLRQIEAQGLHFYSKPGIFGWNKIDRGSELLIDVLQAHSDEFTTDGSLLDLGCGWGYLILATAKLNFSERVATDNNVTAILAAQRNFEEAQLDVSTLTDDCGSHLNTCFNLILCNPPFHQGFSVSEELSKKFIQQTARLLKPKGAALFVVNQFVPLEKLAEGQFTQVAMLAHKHGFKVFSLRK